MAHDEIHVMFDDDKGLALLVELFDPFDQGSGQRRVHARSGFVQQDDLGIAPRFRSCHTAVTEEGYAFEGHVPAKLVQRFLDNPPEAALGLAVPGMPAGSPGMEMGDRVDQYSVFILYKDGRSEHFAEVNGVEILDD